MPVGILLRTTAIGALRLGPPVLAAVLWLVAAASFGAETPDRPSASAVIHLDSGYVRGHLQSSSKPGVLSWQGEGFVAPFEFDMKRVEAVYFPDPVKPERPVGEYCFELASGDVAFGSLVSLTSKDAELDVPLVGRLHLPRKRLQRITRNAEEGGMVYRGPNRLADWHLSSAGAWHNEQGQLWTDSNDASAQSRFTLPSRLSLELILSWTARPNFVLSLDKGYRIEAWKHEMVLVGETEHHADLASLQLLENEAGRVHLFVFLDHPAGTCQVYSSKGVELANMKLTDASRQEQSGLQLTNKRGDIHLERLRIDHWNRGRHLAGEKVDQPRIYLADGSIKYGEVAGYNTKSNGFLLRGSQEASISADRIVDIFLEKTDDNDPRAVTVDYQNSSRFSGSLLKVEKDLIWLASPAMSEPLRLPLAGLRSLIVNPSGAIRKEKEFEAGGVLEIEGTRLPGNLMSGSETTGASCLVWHPHASENSSPLKPTVNGRIVFRESHPGPPVFRREVRRVSRKGAGGRRIVQEFAGVSQPGRGLTKGLFLRTGDTIPCEVTKIDARGVAFTTALSESGVVANDKIKAVVLTLDGRGSVELTQEKRDRLLTLPRMQKENPPTHLIRSIDGDYLRGRILEMDDDKLVVEIRLQPQTLPRELISRIIWLHPDEFEGAPVAKKSSPPGPQPRVQAIHDNGTRLTFHPSQVTDSVLSGTSDAIGACRIAVSSIDQLLIGTAIDEAVTKTAYQQWKLRYALEPKFLAAEANAARGANPAGVDSALVGKPAPDFELELLDGEQFHLAGHKGKTVVLDFWATWCGPCLQTMPALAQVHRESAADGIQVVAVNLEETPEQIRGLLKRLKLQVPVALDRDGAIAARYGVTSIPQTLIIDRDGKVFRHFVGGGAHYGKELADALHELAAAPSSKKTP
jgi:thiol-disulfide isomerase/thioredoxin